MRHKTWIAAASALGLGLGSLAMASDLVAGGLVASSLAAATESETKPQEAAESITDSITVESKTATSDAQTNPNSAERQQSYNGRSYHDWKQDFQTELDPVKRAKAVKALVLFGVNGKADEVVPLILDLLDSYPHPVPLYCLEGREEIQKELADGTLPEGLLEVGLLDLDDLKLYMTAELGLSRLSARGSDQLVEYLKRSSEFSAGKVSALKALVYSPQRYFRLVPQMMSQDSMVQQLTLELLRRNPVSSSNEFEQLISVLINLEEPRLRVVLEFLSQSPFREHAHRIIPQLQQRLTTIEELQTREAIEKVIQTLSEKKGAA